jgi:photosystem II stability/assembly factor-like uncharacterized protein
MPLVQVIWSPANGDAYCGTVGVTSAFSVSRDGGVSWNQMALMDISHATQLHIVDIAVVDGMTLYALFGDDIDGDGVVEQGDLHMVMKTTDGGANWERIYSQRSGANADRIRWLALSPEYATDETFFAAQTDKRIWKSSNGGQTFVGLTAPEDITAIGVVDANTYFTGHIGEVYKSGRWTAGDIKGGDTPNEIVIAPDGTLYVGTDDGEVQTSTDDGQNFRTLGATANLGAGENVYVAVDPKYTENNVIYAGTSNGISRWKVGTDSAWKDFTADAAGVDCRGIRVSADTGILYAANEDLGEGAGRVSYPLLPISTPANWPDFMDNDLGVAGGNPGLTDIEIGSGSTVVYAIAVGTGAGTYGYTDRIFVFTDELATSPTLSAPKDRTVVPVTLSPTGEIITGTMQDFSWKAVSTASGISLWYRVEIATDRAFKNKVFGADDTNNTRGTTLPVNLANLNLVPGGAYYWRVYADSTHGGIGTGTTKSQKSASRSFTIELPAPFVKSPEYGATTQLKPTFSWIAVQGATSYELELSTNPFFANAQVKKPLSHTTWTWDEELEFDTNYYWRVRAVKSGKGILTNNSDWAEAVFTTRSPDAPAPPPPVQVIEYPPAPPQPAPQITLPQPQVILPAAAPPPAQISPPFIWAIIIIGAVLVIAVIVLIVRTRRIG